MWEFVKRQRVNKISTNIIKEDASTCLRTIIRRR